MKNNYCTFYIARHGETIWNKKGLLQGHKNSALTKNGLKQAENLSQKLKNIKFSAIFSSDLIRAKKTAEMSALDKGMAVATSKLLRERYFGRFEGKKVDDYKSFLKKQIDYKNYLYQKENDQFRRKNNIETNEALISRFITFLRETAAAYLGKKVLVVSHGSIMRILLIHLGFAGRNQLPGDAIENSGYFVLESDGIDFFVRETCGINKLK